MPLDYPYCRSGVERRPTSGSEFVGKLLPAVAAPGPPAQKEHRLSSLTIVFPCISTGIYHFPKALACSIAVDTVRDTLSELQAEKEIDVIFCCYESEDALLYKRQLDNKGD